MNATWTAVSHAGTGSRSAPARMFSGSSTSGSIGRFANSLNSRRKSRKYASVDATIAITALQPKCPSMNPVVQFQCRATISTGGAAKCVSVPPIDTFTNNSPSVAYFRRVLGVRS